MAYTAVPSPRDVAPSDLRAAYQAVYDGLGTLYWECTDVASKDLVFGAREAVGQIIDALNQQQLEANTQALVALLPKIEAANTALAEIQTGITRLTRNLNTASSVVNAISLALSLVPVL